MKNIIYKNFLLSFFLYLLPISIILGNAAINILSFFIILSFLSNLYLRRFIIIENKFFFISFFILLFLLILNIFFSDYRFSSSKSSIGIIRYYLVFLAIYITLKYPFVFGKTFKDNFFKIFFFSLIFVIFDTYLQLLFGKDLFGYTVHTSHAQRLSGPFGPELIVGAYMSKIFFIALLGFSLFKKKKYFFSLSIITLIIIIFSNERSASIIFFCALNLFYFLNLRKLKYKFLFIIISFFIVILLFSLNSGLKRHFVDIPLKYFKDNHHKAHFLTGLSIYKDNKILGSGLKTYRYVCSKKKYENINSKYKNNRCATHPHNIYIEVISETGLVGFFILIAINCYILMFLSKRILFKIATSFDYLIFALFFILFFPFQTTGSFFSTWNGIFYWLFLSIFFYYRSTLTINFVKR